jgi:PST family polysaccharide transporter
MGKRQGTLEDLARCHEEPGENLSQQHGRSWKRDMKPAGSSDQTSSLNLKSRKLLRSGVVHNVIALYGVQACTYALPLLTFPYLARVLGPSGWGVVVFAQAIGEVIASVVEYGFDISAARDTSRHRNDPKHLSALISGVLGAKFLLAVLCIAGAIFSRRFTHHIAPSLALFWASTIWGVCQGINMLWYFQGLERMRLASMLEISGKVLATLSIFVLVHKPSDGWKVLAAQCVGCVVAHGITVVLAYREVGFQWPNPAMVWDSLRLGTSMFLFRAVQSISGSANRLILGSVAPVAALGEYAGAERITRVFQQGMWPVNQALYPRLTKQMQDSPGQAMKTVKYSLLLLGGLGMLFGLAIYLGAPLLVRFVLGPAFRDSVPVLRVFSLWIPLIALTTVIIFQLLLPNQLDTQFNFVNYSAAFLGFGVAFLLVPRLAAVGIAWAAVSSQSYTLVAFIFVLWRAKLNPFALTTTAPARAPSMSDLAGVSGMDHEEAPVEFLVTEQESLLQKGFVE